MDSPVFQSPTSHHYPTTHQRGNSTSYPAPASAHRNRSGIHKRSSHQDRSSISLSQPDRLYRWASEQSHQINPSSLPSPAIDAQWITPQQSPQTQGFSLDSTIEPFSSSWGVPTPPRSDSGVPNLSVDASDEPITNGVAAAHAFSTFDHPATTAEMSSLGYLLPSQYGNSYETDANNSYQNMDQSYISSKRMSQPAASSGVSAYASTASSSPDLYQSRHSRPVDSRSLANLDSTYRRVSGHYEGNNYALSSGPTIPPISGLQAQLPSPHATSPNASMMLNYPGGVPRSSVMYDSVYQNQAYATTQPASHLYSTSPPVPQSYMPTSNVADSLGKQPGSDASNRMLNQRPKPQCWDHGCNGRQFSTFSNLLRHQREKSGTAAKSYCPKCGAEFTRTTARNGHLAHDKCTKQRRPSDAK